MNNITTNILKNHKNYTEIYTKPLISEPSVNKTTL